MKKALSLSMALAMSAAMLAGCGGSASGSTSASGAASSAGSTASGTPTVTFMIPDFTGHVLSNEHSDEVIAKYEDYTGTHVEWRTEANDTYSEKFGLTLMDKDNMPMMLMWIDGYMSGKSDNTVISDAWMEKLGMHLGTYCGKNPGKTIMDAMEAMPAE